MTELNLPDGVTQAEAQALVDELASDRAKADRKRERCEAILNSDEAFLEYAKELCVPIVRARVYDKIEWDQELPEFRFSSSPDRPVVMRGSLKRLIWRWSRSNSSCANGWCLMVVERYLRKIKFTCLDSRQAGVLFKNIERNLESKHRTSYHFGQAIYWSFRMDLRETKVCWVAGELRYDLSDAQFRYIQRLSRATGKMHDLDRRIAMLDARK